MALFIESYYAHTHAKPIQL